MDQYKIILASSSPRRIEILKNKGIDPVIIPPSVNENLPAKISTEQAVMYLAIKKALSVERIWLKESKNITGKTAIIAADTVVYKDKIIGKPKDYDDAVRILESLRNTSHFVVTGVAIINAGTNKRFVFYDTTEVFFKDYTDDDIKNYIDTKEPWDKAGAYAIQGNWGKHIDHIEGDYDNVVGFPWSKIEKLLKSSYTD